MLRREVLATLAAGAGWTASGTRTARESATQDPTRAFEPLGSVALEGARELAVGDDGEVAFVAANDGVATVDCSDPAAPRVLAERRDLLADDPGGPLRELWDVWPDGDRLLAVAPAHRVDEAREVLYAAVLLDVADPTAPTVLDAHRTGAPIHNCAFEDGVAYLTVNDGDRQALELLYADDTLEPVGEWTLRDVDEAWGEVPAPIRQLHDVTVSGDRAVLAHWDAGTWLLDVSDPAAPTAVGHVAQHDREALQAVEDVEGELLGRPGNAHFAELDGDLLAVGREAWELAREGCVEGGPGAVDLYDAGDPAAIEHLARIPAPKSYRNTQDDAFTTSHNFHLVDDRLYTSWYHGGVKIHDVSDPAAPEELAWWRRPDEAAFWTARLGLPGEFVAASSAENVAGYDESIEGRVYTFPDAAGEQPDPPSLLERPADFELRPRCDVASLASEFREETGSGDGSRDGDGGDDHEGDGGDDVGHH